MDGQSPRLASLFLVPPSLVFVGILLFVALLNHQHQLIVLSLLVLGTAGSAKLWARLSRSRLACHSAVDRSRLFPGEPLALTLEAGNRSWLPMALHVTAPVGGLLGPSGEAVSGEAGLLWYQKVEFHWTLTASRRGVHRLGPHRCTTGDLFGFFTSTRMAGEAQEIIVYPRIVPVARFPLPRRDFFGIPGAESPVRDPIYILGTREYQSGQPAKHIHWKATARHHRLQEKLFEPTEQEKILLVVDVEGFARHADGQAFERTLEAVASLAVRLDREGSAVGLIANGVIEGGGGSAVPIGRHPRQLPSILELLARLSMNPAASLLDAIRAGNHLPWGISCLCFSAENAGGTISALEYFGKPPRADNSLRRAPRRRSRRGGRAPRGGNPSRGAGGMSGRERLLLHALTNGMELSWLCAWVTFATIGTMGRPFPLVEASVAFVGAFVLTRLSSGKAWRVVWIVGAQAVGLLAASAGILHGLYYPGRPLLRQAWLLDFLGAARSPTDWCLLALALVWTLFFWIGGARLAVRPLVYATACSRFDLGLAAFFLLFLIKLLVAVNGGRVDDRISYLFLLPFFVSSLMTIGMIRLRSDGRKAFLSGYRGLGIFLTFSVTGLLFTAALMLFSLPYLTVAAEAGLVALKGAGLAISPLLLWVLRRLFAPQTLRTDPASAPSRHALSTIPAHGQESWWMAVFEKALLWSAGILLVLAAIALIGLCVYLLLRFLLSRTPSRRDERQTVSPLAWLRRLMLFVSGLRARLTGLRCARNGYRALLAWARRSGLPSRLVQTPSELGARLQQRFPPLRAEIGSIVEAFNEEVYREVVLPGERITEIRSAWRRLRSPRQWPVRFRAMWRGD